MTKKAKRRILFIGAVLIVGIALFAWTVYGLTSEHPDYIVAARGLDEARSRAGARYGPLTWDDLRRAEGRPTRESKNDGKDEWSALVKSMPKPMADQWLSGTAITDYAKTFRPERAWLVSLSSKLETLAIQYDTSGSYTHLNSFTRAKELMKACCFGIIGAADSGDTEAIAEIGSAARLLVLKVLEEPCIMSALVTDALRSVIHFGIVTAAVRNRSNADVLGALIAALESLPDEPSMRSLLAGEVRAQSVLLQVLRSRPLSKLDQDLDVQESENFLVEPSGFDKLFLELRKRITGEEATGHRRIGSHTLDALEARELEYSMDYEDIEARVSGYEEGTREIERLDQSIRRRKDRSYELSLFEFASTYRQGRCRFRFQSAAARTCLRLLRAYPNVSDLPANLPDHLRLIDPFTGLDTAYVRSSKGFMLYTVGHNQRDDGFSTVTHTGSGPWGKFVKGTKSGDDWGYYVQY